MAEERWLIVGLGNPGSEYAGNRHNIGFMVADVLAARLKTRQGAKFKRDRSRAEVATGVLAGHAGDPGQAAGLHERVRRAGEGRCARFYKIPPDRIVVIHDELDLPFGDDPAQDRRRRQRPQRAAIDDLVAGHQGLPPRPVRHRAAAGADGPRRLRARATSRRPSGRSCPCWWTGPPTWSRPCWPAAWPRRRTTTSRTSRPGLRGPRSVRHRPLPAATGVTHAVTCPLIWLP